ncbi:MAG: cyclase family protein, partial [Gammaproteobacteria bacterium]
YAISLADVKGALSRQEISLQAGDAVLIHTGWGALYGKDNDEFLAGEPGLGMEAVDWLYRQRIAITGPTPGATGRCPARTRNVRIWCRRRCTSKWACSASKIWRQRNSHRAGCMNSCSC